MISLIFMYLILVYRPFASERLNSTQSGSLMSNILTLFVGIMLIVADYQEDEAKRSNQPFDSREREVITVLIFIINLLVMAIPGLKLLSDARVLDTITANFSDHFGNKEEKQKIADMMGLCDDTQSAKFERTVSSCQPRLGSLPGSFCSKSTSPDLEFSRREVAPASLPGEMQEESLCLQFSSSPAQRIATHSLSARFKLSFVSSASASTHPYSQSEEVAAREGGIEVRAAAASRAAEAMKGWGSSMEGGERGREGGQ